MPIYEYEGIERDCGLCPGRFECIQRMSEDALSTCPTCGQAVRRVVSQAAFSMEGKLNYDSAATKGFTTYKKAGGGMYEKVAGEGPATLDKNQ